MDFGQSQRSLPGVFMLNVLFSGIISFKGSTMVDCPEKLYSGADLLVSLSFHMLPGAFKRYNPDPDNAGLDKTWYNEGTETNEEIVLRNRKESLQQLFEKLGLTPRMTANSTYDKENIPPEGSQPPRESSSGYTKKGLSDRNELQPKEEEDAEDDAENLNQDDLDVIYRRSVSSYICILWHSSNMCLKGSSQRC